MLRVIAGKYRSRNLEQPPLSVSRPTMDRIKEAMFSSIQFQIPGSIVLDLFAGSGAFAIEAVSREAMKAIAVENNEQAIKVIKENVEALNINNITVIKADVLDYLDRLRGTKFDLIFLDPPYDQKDLYQETLLKIAQNHLLSDLGLIVLEKSTQFEILVPDSLAVQKVKEYGKTKILMLANNI